MSLDVGQNLWNVLVSRPQNTPIDVDDPRDIGGKFDVLVLEDAGGQVQPCIGCWRGASRSIA